jgi:hypothetical protein
MRLQTERLGLHGILGQADRGLAEKLNLLCSSHALGTRRAGGEMC